MTPKKWLAVLLTAGFLFDPHVAAGTPRPSASPSAEFSSQALTLAFTTAPWPSLDRLSTIRLSQWWPRGQIARVATLGIFATVASQAAEFVKRSQTLAPGVTREHMEVIAKAGDSVGKMAAQVNREIPGVKVSATSLWQGRQEMVGDNINLIFAKDRFVIPGTERVTHLLPKPLADVTQIPDSIWSVYGPEIFWTSLGLVATGVLIYFLVRALGKGSIARRAIARTAAFAVATGEQSRERVTSGAAALRSAAVSTRQSLRGLGRRSALALGRFLVRAMVFSMAGAIALVIGTAVGTVWLLGQVLELYATLWKLLGRFALWSGRWTIRGLRWAMDQTTMALAHTWKFLRQPRPGAISWNAHPFFVRWLSHFQIPAATALSWWVVQRGWIPFEFGPLLLAGLFWLPFALPRGSAFSAPVFKATTAVYLAATTAIFFGNPASWLFLATVGIWLADFNRLHLAPRHTYVEVASFFDYVLSVRQERVSFEIALILGNSTLAVARGVVWLARGTLWLLSWLRVPYSYISVGFDRSTRWVMLPAAAQQNPAFAPQVAPLPIRRSVRERIFTVAWKVPSTLLSSPLERVRRLIGFIGTLTFWVILASQQSTSVKPVAAHPGASA